MAVYLGTKMLTDLLTGDAELVPENIREGAEVFGVQGTYKGAASGKFELIETFTAEEDVAFDRSAEPDGTPYKFMAVIAFIETAATVTATNLYYYHEKTACTLSYILAKSTTTKGRTVLSCAPEYGYWISKWYNSWSSGSTVGVNSCYQWRMRNEDKVALVNLHPYITRIKTSGSLPAGTTIEIWGVRA